MILEKPKTVGSTVTLKLASGEEIIARYEQETEHSITIKMPVQLVMSERGAAMLPYLMSVDPNRSIVISKSGIIVCELTHTDFDRKYLEVTTGIELS